MRQVKSVGLYYDGRQGWVILKGLQGDSPIIRASTYQAQMYGFCVQQQLQCIHMSLKGLILGTFSGLKHGQDDIRAYKRHF